MRKIIFLPLAAGLMALGACQSEQADNVEDAADAKADQLDEAADQAPTETGEDMLENQADAVRQQGDATADAIDETGGVAPTATTTPPAQ